MIEKLKMQTPNLTDKNIEQIEKLFPHVMTETRDENENIRKAIDFDLLKQDLSHVLVDDDSERYRLDWPGKKASLLKANTPITKTLRPCREESVNFDTTENLYIEGDNFEGLKILQESYLGKIKMIYIDPPYNTGKDFIYKDNFRVSKEEYEEEIGVVNDEGGKLFRNTDSNGRFHSDWLSMMYERLIIARDFLKNDGVIFISIDDSEVHNLRKICDEVFGEENFVNQISIKAKPSSGASGGGQDIKLKKNIEYLLCYCKSKGSFSRFNDVFDDRDLLGYIREYKEEGKSWKYTRVLTSLGEKEFHSEIKDGAGKPIKIFKHENVEMRTLSELADREGLTENDVHLKYFDRIFRDTNAQSSIRQRLLDATDNNDTFYSIEYVPVSGRNKDKITTLYYKGRNKDLIAWLSDVAFKEGKKIIKKDKVGTLWDNFNWNNVSKEGDIQYPNGKKPIAFIQRMISLCSSSKKEDLVLDFFSGSGSVAHAVFAQNFIDGGKRKCISVQLLEPISKNEKKKYYAAEEFKHFETICDIGKERIRRAGRKILEDNKDKEGIEKLDIGYRIYKTDTTNMKDVYYHPDKLGQMDISDYISNIKEDRTPDDLLTQVILDLGLELNLPIEKNEMLGNTVFIVQNNALVACFDDNINFKIVGEIAGLKPFKVVFKDASFENDKDRINLEERFKRLSPETVITVI
jgi:adenine-specific DNA-methyltransferase